MKIKASGEYLTTAEAAEMLAVHQGKIIDWIALGLLPAFNVALRAGPKPRWRIRRADLDEFLRQRSSEVVNA
jgi:excisionase family DNA binding protein